MKFTSLVSFHVSVIFLSACVWRLNRSKASLGATKFKTFKSSILVSLYGRKTKMIQLNFPHCPSDNMLGGATAGHWSFTTSLQLCVLPDLPCVAQICTVQFYSDSVTTRPSSNHILRILLLYTVRTFWVGKVTKLLDWSTACSAGCSLIPILASTGIRRG